MTGDARLATVLIVDDHDGYRHQARRILEAAGYTVVGEACDGNAALEAVGTIRPDLVLVDVGLPDVDGIALARWIASRSMPPRVILVSSRDETAFGSRVRSCGAIGFIPKEDLSGLAIGALMGRTASCV